MHQILDHMGYYLDAYVGHLERLGQTQLNIRTVLCDFEHIFMKFYLGERSGSVCGHQERANLVITVSHAFQLSLNEAAKRCNKARRLHKLCNTWEKHVLQNKLPAGGIKQLQDMITAQRAYWDTKLAILESPDTPADLINSFIGFILAAMYCFNIQGRVKAFNEMTMKDAYALIADGRVCIYYFLK